MRLFLTMIAILYWAGAAQANGVCIMQGTNQKLPFQGNLQAGNDGSIKELSPLTKRGSKSGAMYGIYNKDGSLQALCSDKLAPDFSARATDPNQSTE